MKPWNGISPHAQYARDAFFLRKLWFLPLWTIKYIYHPMLPLWLWLQTYKHNASTDIPSVKIYIFTIKLLSHHNFKYNQLRPSACLGAVKWKFLSIVARFRLFMPLWWVVLAHNRPFTRWYWPTYICIVSCAIVTL